MSIAFKFESEVQIIKITGAITRAEESPLRLKLDQKITQGRKKILLDLVEMDFESADSIAVALGLIDFCVSQKVGLACCAPKGQWRHFLKKSSHHPELFEHTVAGMSWFHTAKPPEAAQPSTDAAQDPELAIKAKMVSELLSKYRHLDSGPNLDPFNLEGFKGNYEKTPHRDAVVALFEAAKEVKKKTDHTNELEKECQLNSKEVYDLTKLRKAPISADELQLKKKSLEELLANTKKELTALKGQVESTTRAAEDWDKTSQKHKEEGEKKLREAEHHLENQKKHNESMQQEWTKKDQEEETQLQNLKQAKAAPPKPTAT